MRQNKNAAPVCETGNGMGQIVLGGFEMSIPHDTAERSRFQGLCDLIPHSKGTAITGEDLARLLGVTRREATRYIMEARRGGVPIMSDPASGYWLAETEEEIRCCVSSLRRRAGEILDTAAALEQRGGEGK